MPRANRHFLPGHVWHITHRCQRENRQTAVQKFKVQGFKSLQRYVPGVPVVQPLRSVQNVESREKVKRELRTKAVHREVTEVTGTYTLREQSEACAAYFDGDAEPLRPENTVLWEENPETTQT
jgi:hypothetical protein